MSVTLNSCLTKNCEGTVDLEVTLRMLCAECRFVDATLLAKDALNQIWSRQEATGDSDSFAVFELSDAEAYWSNLFLDDLGYSEADLAAHYDTWRKVVRSN